MEKRKIPSASLDNNNDGDQSFLDKSGATDQLRDVLAKVIENRPSDPISFFAEYFECLGDKVDRVGQAHRQICLAHYSKPAFHSNIMAAYDILSQNKVHDRKGKPIKREGSGKPVRGVTGSAYNDLLKEICKEFPASVAESLMKKTTCRDHEVILFSVFQSGICTCLVLRDYLKQVEALYRSLEHTAASKPDTPLVDRLLCETILHLLRDSIKSTKDAHTSILEVGYKLAPDRVYATLATAMFKSGCASQGVMKLDEFQIAAADYFLLKITQAR